MIDRPDIETLAAEYALGTLDAAERMAVAARRQREPALDAAIADWEQRLAPLADAVAPVAPSADLFPAIEARLSAAPPKTAVDLTALMRSRNRWRMGALAASAVAAAVLVAAGGLEYTRLSQPEKPQNYVAVFQKDGTSPAFVLAVDLANRTLSVRRVAADLPPGKSYQLWIAADKLGPGMHSLGLVNASGVQHAIAGIDPTVVQQATFGVSLEPEGGSPTGQPTGPAFVAKLIPIAQ
jgi:anti-sigma-K factor RskA